ncbi:hypothetical protein CFC35_22815 [Streptomyces sp. FBKL.4005]|uniref:DUF5994 family protein n=1 Tax=Streptomyces TaxID=1883 RepID=UPI000B96522C|nr:MULTISPECIES: DUF5994 family protein [unclassified Streptomyces]OYP16987.1 hypothetical protein CFC35_22815 [Streptomyces sp. FBKL.4005]BCM67524.1 hypothetical protein EASAB2608_02858 [Streptomyces sp. EAS-AB2608]
MGSTEGISHTGFHAGSSPAKDDTRAAAQVARRQVRTMSATLYPTLPHREPIATPAARLALKTDGASRGLLDGAWWPRSRDLLSELPALTDVLDPLWGRITRIAVNPEHWPVIPRKIPVAGHIVKAGWFTPELDPHKLLLLSYGTGRWDLLVIPPGTGAASAARLMAAASGHDGPPLTASALIAADDALDDVPGDDRPGRLDEVWEYEGGASAVPAAVFGQTGPPGPASRLIVGM